MFLKKIIFIFLISSVIFAESKSVKELNQKGLRNLNQGNLPVAMESFQKVIKLEPKNAFAHYNLACTLSVQLEKDYCSYMENIPLIYKHIQQAIKNKSSYKIQMLKDPDFSPVQKEFAFYKMAGFSTRNSNHIRMILQRVQWFGPSPGVFGPKNGIVFLQDGSFQYWTAEFNSEGNLEKKYYKGIYNIQKSTITLELKEKVPEWKRSKFQGTIKSGKLIFPGFPNSFTDDGSLCSA